VPPAILRELLEEILSAEQIGYEPAVLPLVVRAGAGSARDSLSVLDQLLAGAGEEGLRYDRTVALLGYTDENLLDEVADAFANEDGAAGLAAIHDAGGVTVVQSPQTARAAQMALSALKLRPADCVLPLDEIAKMLRTLDADGYPKRMN